MAVRLGEWLSNNRVLSRFQEGFVRNKSMIDSIFIIETTGARYLRSIQGYICSCLLDLQKACDPINRGAIWYKLQRKGLIVGLMECIESMFEDTEFCVRWKNDQVPELIPQEIGVRQVCSLSPYLFNIGIDDVEYIQEGNKHSVVMGELTIPGLLFMGYVAVVSLTISGLQKG